MLGDFLYFIDMKRKPIARENMRRSGIAPDPAELERLLRENYRHYGTLILEILHLFSPFPGHYASYTRKTARFHGIEHWKKARDKGRGVIFVSAHLANWELMASSGAQNGIDDLTMATRRLKPAWLHEKVASSRLSTGVRSAVGREIVISILKSLKRGGSVGFVLDQYEAPPYGLPSKFLGLPAYTLGAPAELKNRTSAAILPVRQERKEDGIVHVTVEPELETEPGLDAAAMTQIYLSRVEGWVRQNPAQWLWVHRRFKNPPPEEGNEEKQKEPKRNEKISG